jgi:hypothetical protein
MKSVQLALAACRARQSRVTGFVHWHPDGEGEEAVPFLENLLFAWALLRTRSVEGALEGQALARRLLAYQLEGGRFPRYLHEFPESSDPYFHLRVAPYLAQGLKEGLPFGSLLERQVKSALERVLEAPAEEPFWEKRRLFLRGEGELPRQKGWGAEALAYLQLGGKVVVEACYDPELGVLVGEDASLYQEGLEPQMQVVEWLLGEAAGSLPERLKRVHPAQMLLGGLWPVEWKNREPCSLGLARQVWWGEGLHSFVAGPGAVEGEGKLHFPLSGEPLFGKEDLFEAVCFCDASEGTEIFVEGEKASTFRLGEEIEVRTPGRVLKFCFVLEKGSGDFRGQICRANRPGQLFSGNHLKHSAFDFRIGVRTLRRSQEAAIALLYRT